jgi:hypothetical protein
MTGLLEPGVLNGDFGRTARRGRSPSHHSFCSMPLPGWTRQSTSPAVGRREAATSGGGYQAAHIIARAASAPVCAAKIEV